MFVHVYLKSCTDFSNWDKPGFEKPSMATWRTLEENDILYLPLILDSNSCQLRASYFWSDKETKFCLSVMKESNIGSLDKRKQQNADLCKSIVKGLQDTGRHICAGVLVFNSAKPAVNHSGVMFL